MLAINQAIVTVPIVSCTTPKTTGNKMSNDLRREQVALLRFEKQLAGLAASLAAGAAVVKSVDGKLPALQAQDAYQDIQLALVQLAEATERAHDAVNAQALEHGMRLLNVTGGVPKERPRDIALSILGLG